jgi:hypothetical protein
MSTKHVSVYRRTGRAVWYAAFPDAKSGKRICRATEARVDDPQGFRKAWNWVREQAREGVLLRHEAGGSEWGQWVDDWLHLRYRTQASSLTNALNWWSWLSLWLREVGCNTPRALDRSMVMRYPQWRTAQRKRSGKRVSFNSAIQEIKLLARIMDEAIARGFAEKNPAARMGLKKDPPPEKPELTDGAVEIVRRELDRLEGALPLRERWRSIAFEVALHTGCRHGETEVPFDLVDWAGNTMRFRDSKHNKFYTIPIHPGLRALLDRLRAEGATRTVALPVKRISSQTWSRFFKRLGRKYADRPEMQGLCFHSTRVTVITRFARDGVPIQQAMAYVHHGSELIHKIYQRLRPADVAPCVRALAYPQRDDSDWEQTEDAGQSSD